MADKSDPFDFPKLSLAKITSIVADLWLLWDGSVEWLKEPRLRRTWRVFFRSTVLIIVSASLLVPILNGLLETSPLATLWGRSLLLAAFVWLLVVLGYLGYLYYRYLLITAKDVRFVNVPFFWCTWVILFAIVYMQIYLLSPQLYSYTHPALVPQKTVTTVGLLTKLKFVSDFTIYSACTSVMLSVPGLASSSFVVTALNLVELLGFILLLALLVATFVNMYSRSR